MKTETTNNRIDTSFKRGTDDTVNNLTLDVEDALPNHPVFTKLPVSLTDLEALRLTFVGTMTEARKGGLDRTRLKKQAKQALVDALMKTALYCMGEALHDRDLFLSSGFEVVAPNHTSYPLDPPSINDLLNNVSGQLTVRGVGVVNGRQYKARASTDGGKTWMEIGTFNSARRIVLQPVTPGTTYMVELCAMGGSTGQSPWSDPVSRMAT